MININQMSWARIVATAMGSSALMTAFLLGIFLIAPFEASGEIVENAVGFTLFFFGATIFFLTVLFIAKFQSKRFDDHHPNQPHRTSENARAERQGSTYETLSISGDASELPPVSMGERTLIKPETVEISGAGKSSKEEHHWYLASGAILLLLTLLPLIGPSMEKLAIFLAGSLPMALVAFLLSRIGTQGDKTKRTPWRIEFGVFLLLWLSCLLLKPLFHLIASGQNENTVIVIRELGPILVAVIIGRLTLNQVTKTFHKK